MGAVWRGVLLVLIPSLCHGLSTFPGPDFMAIGGPLWSHVEVSYNGEGSRKLAECNNEVLTNMRDQIQTLQKFGVTHYKVRLDWIENPLDRDDGHLQCYRTLLQMLNEANVRPIVILHGGDLNRPSAGGTQAGPNPVDSYAEYAEFAFRSFGDLVHTWITFDVPADNTDSQSLQVLLDAHERVYTLYHQKYSAKGGRISIALAPFLLDSCFSLRGNFLKSVDFIALNINHDCQNPQELQNWITDKHNERNVETVIFSLSMTDCKILSEEDRYVLMFHIYSGISASFSKLMGYDMSYLLSKSSKSNHLLSKSIVGKGRSENLPDRSSSSRSAFTTVWQKFSGQTPAERDAFLHDTFPNDFLMGSSSSAFKVEGGWAEGDKGHSIWDVFGQNNQADNNATANLACDSYHKIDYDVYLLKGLQSKVYHFSISWSRIFPTGLSSKVNAAGVKYYNRLIDRLIRENIKPMVTLYHWDLPQALQESGGWQSESTTQAFMEYADFCYSNFGDRVKHWITFHEPWVVSYAGYGTGQHPPGIKDPGNASFKVIHNIVKAHAKAWHVYNDKYRAQQQGQVGISLNSDWAEPKDPNNPDDVSAAERYLQFMLGWFAHPILVNGDYPEVLKTQVNHINTQCSSILAQLPAFTEEEKAYINGTADFLGISHYTSRLVNGSQSGSCVADYDNIGGFAPHVDPLWPTTSSPWLYVVPWGLRRLLNFVKEEYIKGGLPIYITGNGMPTAYTGEVYNDTDRVEYLTAYINEALKAVKTDNVTVSAFVVRSLLDGFEGPQGYSQRFGLHHVDFENGNRPRTPKQSAYLISNIAENNGFPRTKLVKKIPLTEWIHTKKLPALPASEVPSKAKIVWNKFSGQTAFERDMYHYSTVPSDFKWGVSTSAFQIEGGWNEDGKGPSIWDTFSHIPGNIFDNGNADIACDSYHQLDADLYMLRSLGVNSYRFSISWSRIFPTGQGTVNSKGVDYYNRLIDGLLANNISPMVTLYHFDLPQALQDIGGWENDTVLEAFHSYADYCFRTFGDRVKFWMTFHQPHTIVATGYGNGLFPPGVKDDPGNAPYRVAHNLIKVHAKVYHTYDEQYRKSQGGYISLSLNTNWVEPKDYREPRDIEAADRYLQFTLGWFAHPIFKNGDYPEAMKWQVANKSDLQGLQSSRLPAFTDEEKAYIQGTADVFFINIYTTKIVQHQTTVLFPPSFQNDIDITEEFDSSWPDTAAENFKAVAWGLRRLLNWVKEEYEDVPIYITENGVAMDRNTDFDDYARISYHQTYIDEALKALKLDGVNLKGYSINSLMDSFEWNQGYRFRFGLHHVDFNHPTRARAAKRTAIYYAEIIANNGIPFQKEDEFLYGEFQDDFAWGVASSSFQIEGAWRADGKGLSIWDQFTHTPSKIVDGTNGDVACNSYYRVDEDIELLKELRVSHYRFSISWPRILPDGTLNHINEAGISYYSRLIDGMMAAGITPQVTIYHWDLPQALQDVGGWVNETIIDRFKDYAELLFQRLGDRVKFWITLNEPYIIAHLGYGEGAFAPGIYSPGIYVYEVGHNLIKAHAEVWHLYNDTYRASQGGLISITLNSDWAEPINPYKQEDVDAAWRYLMFFAGWFGYPIFKTGDYPEIMKSRVRERSLAFGLPKSRLPEFTESEKQRIKGTYDFFGLNHYTTCLVGQALGYDLEYQAYQGDRGVYLWSDRTWLGSGSVWLRVTPFGLRRLLRWIKEEFNNPAIYITENGISERGTNLNDEWRTYYYKHYINEAMKAVKFDGVDLRGYSAWSLMDNFEWAEGYSERFGLYYVNFSDPNLPRLPKESVKYYRSVVQCKGFPDPDNGPHPCLSPEPEGTTSRPTAGLTTGPPEDPDPPAVDFLGLKISTSDAMIALYVEFAILLAAVLTIVLLVVLISKLRKKLKVEELF